VRPRNIITGEDDCVPAPHLGFVRPYRSRLILGLLCGILYGLTNGAFVVVLRLVIDLIFPTAARVRLRGVEESAEVSPAAGREHYATVTAGGGASKVAVALAIGAIPFVMLLRGLLSYLNVYLMSWAAIRAVADMRTKLFGHLQKPLSPVLQQIPKPGDLISRITNDTIVLYNIIGASFASIIKDPITLIVLLSILLSQQPKLTLISMLVFPVCLVPMIIYGRKCAARSSHSKSLPPS